MLSYIKKLKYKFIKNIIKNISWASSLQATAIAIERNSICNPKYFYKYGLCNKRLKIKITKNATPAAT
jgi:hypothetical protein